MSSGKLPSELFFDTIRGKKSNPEPKKEEPPKSNQPTEMSRINEIIKRHEDIFGFSTLLNDEGKYLLQRIDHAFNILLDDMADGQSEIQWQREKIKRLEIKIKDLKNYIIATGHDSEYEKWKKAQGQGRKPKTIDMERYNLLEKAQIPKKEIAKLLGVSPNTLRKILSSQGK